MHHKKLTVFWRKYFPAFPENRVKNISCLWCCHRIWWLFVSLLWICYRHPPSTTTHTPTSHPHILAPCGRNTAHGELLRATTCFLSPFQFTALLSSSWEKFQVWTHFRSPVACGKHFHSHSCTSPPCSWMLTSTSFPATARVQPGELLQLTAWQEKAEGMSSISPFRW